MLILAYSCLFYNFAVQIWCKWEHIKYKIMATANFYLDTRRIKDNGKYPIRIRIQHKGKFLISTPFDSSEESWSGTEYNRKEPNFKPKNVALRNLINKIEGMLLEMDGKGELQKKSDKDLKEWIKNALTGRKKDRTFIEVMKEFASTKMKKSTAACYEGTVRKLEEYDKWCTFDTIDRKWLNDFNSWMLESGIKVNSCGIHLRNIRSVFNYSIDEGYTELYPFRRFSIPKEDTRKRSLSIDQIRALRDFACEEWQERYRDMFMLMFYLIGINAADLFNARKSDVVNGRLEYKRAKTGKLYSVLIEPEAWEIIRKYEGKDYLLDIMDNYANYKDFLHRMNDSLRKIGKMERAGRGGKKVRTPLFPDISSYWSRHTWATIAAGLDIPKETISEALGHSIGSEVTSIYIRFDRKKVDAANRKVIDYVNGEDDSGI